jgi:hypothetical protein
MDNEDFMYFLDQALQVIVGLLPSDHPKTALLDHMMPYMQSLDDDAMCLPISQFEEAM